MDRADTTTLEEPVFDLRDGGPSGGRDFCHLDCNGLMCIGTPLVTCVLAAPSRSACWVCSVFIVVLFICSRSEVEISFLSRIQGQGVAREKVDHKSTAG